MESKPLSRTSGYSVRYNKMYRTGVRLTVPALGDRRRIQALRRIGYPTPAIMAGTGISSSFLRSLADGQTTRVGLKTHKKIVAFYEEHMWHPRFDPVALNAINWSKKRGWAPPGAWDDIDNPEDTPKGVLR